MTNSTLSALLHDLASLAGAAGLIGIGWLLGDGLTRRVRLPLFPLECHLVAVGGGLGILSLAAFLSGVAGAFTVFFLRVLLAAALVLGVILRRRSVPQTTHQEVQPLGSWAAAVAILTGLFLLAFLPATLTPMVDFDGLAYHVGAPKRWLELGQIVHLPTHLHTLWPMAEEMLNGLLLATVGDGACKPLMFLFSLLAAAATFALGERLAGRAAGILAAGLVLYRAGAPSITTTSVEMPLTFFVVLSALLLAVRAAETDSSRRQTAATLAAMLAGCACATKLNGLLCMAFLAVAFVVVDSQKHVSRREIAKNAVRFAGIAVLCATPWYIRSWWITGNPIFPFGYGVLGGSHWSAEAARDLTSYFRTFNLPGDEIALREAYVRRHITKMVGVAAAGLVLPGSPRWVRGLILSAGLFCVLQALTSDNPRFLLPAMPFAAIAIAWWLVRLADRWPALGWVWAAGMAALVLPVVSREARGIQPVLWGGETREEFTVRYVNNVPAFEWANAHLPPDARVLYGPDNRTYYLKRDAYWSLAIYQREISYDTPEAFRASLRDVGIHWLILDRDVYKDGAIQFEIRAGWRENERRRLGEAAAHGRLLFSQLGVYVYELP